MSEFDHWMRLNIGDYVADTMHLSTFQHGLYILLLMHAFRHHGRLPEDEKELARICRCTSLLWQSQGGSAVALFSRVAGGYIHKRVMLELGRAEHVTIVRRSAGKAGAAKRWGEENSSSNGNGAHSKSHKFAKGLPKRTKNLKLDKKEPPSVVPPKSPTDAGDLSGAPAPPHRRRFKNPFLEIIRQEAEGHRDDC